MGDTQRLRVRMDVDERDVARVRPGAAAYVMADAFGEERFTGRVAEIGRRFGRKNIRTDDPVDRNDTKGKKYAEYRAERSVQRKVEEILLAFLLSRRMSKQEVLEMYLNEIYYGNLAYGAQAAS